MHFLSTTELERSLASLARLEVASVHSLVQMNGNAHFLSLRLESLAQRRFERTLNKVVTSMHERDLFARMLVRDLSGEFDSDRTTSDHQERVRRRDVSLQFAQGGAHALDCRRAIGRWPARERVRGTRGDDTVIERNRPGARTASAVGRQS